MDDKDLYAGLIRLHVLHHACQEPIFGGGIIEELARHGYRLSPGTLYPLLYGLEKKGYLRAYEEKDGRQSRRVYRATPKGRRALAAAKIKVRELFSELLEEEGQHSYSSHTTTANTDLIQESGLQLKAVTLSQLRQNAKKATEPKAQALFNVAAVVVEGLIKAFNDYEKQKAR
ncbi:MAG: helix-turn-helix transcriptional regulator [Acidobacteria bacterium]|nr:helix-turn-helix transcriptional regulator [Acidobacteriota bacterium]